MIASRLPGGVIIVAPFKVNLTATELNQLVQMLHQYPGEVRIVMEHTGAYWRPVALTLVNAGFFGSVVNAMLIHDCHDNLLRRAKTDKADALKIANYALTFWEELRPYTGEDEVRQLLKTQCRLYERIVTRNVSLRNGLITLLDQTFPRINQMFYVTVAFAGVDAPPYQSGDFESKSRRRSKRGFQLLRRTLFQICSISLQLLRYSGATFGCLVHSADWQTPVPPIY